MNFGKKHIMKLLLYRENHEGKYTKKLIIKERPKINSQ